MNPFFKAMEEVGEVDPGSFNWFVNLLAPLFSKRPAMDFDETCHHSLDKIHCACWYDGDPCCKCGSECSRFLRTPPRPE